jgi:DNA polymerase III subunit gamma/tau
LATVMPPDETQLLYSIAIHGRSELGLAPDEYTGLTMSLLRLLAFKPKGFKPALSTPAVTATSTASPAAEAEKKSLIEAAENTVRSTPESVVSSAHSGFLKEKERLPGTKPQEFAINSVANQKATGVSEDGAVSPAIVANPHPAPVLDVAAAPKPGLLAVPIREQSASSKLEMRIAPVEPDAHHEAWVQLVQQLLDAQAVAGLVQQLAVQSQCVEKGASHLRLRVAQPTLKSDSARDELQNALQVLGRNEALVIEVGPVQGSWAQRNAAELQARQQAAEALIQADPLVQELISQWGAKIVPGSVRAV